MLIFTLVRMEVIHRVSAHVSALSFWKAEVLYKYGCYYIM